jgi:hypothetical protein
MQAPQEKDLEEDARRYEFIYEKMQELKIKDEMAKFKILMERSRRQAKLDSWITRLCSAVYDTCGLYGTSISRPFRLIIILKLCSTLCMFFVVEAPKTPSAMGWSLASLINPFNAWAHFANQTAAMWWLFGASVFNGLGAIVLVLLLISVRWRFKR